MLTELTKLVSLILAISVASDRLVTFILTLIPALDSPAPTDPPPSTGKEIARKATVMVIAFLAAWLTSLILADKGSWLTRGITIEKDAPPFPCLLMGLLASGGSAFWTHILDYLKGIKDINKEKLVQEKVNTFHKLGKSNEAAKPSNKL